LIVLEAALMNQEGLTGAFCGVLAQCFHLEELDLAGDVNIGDDGIQMLPRGEIRLNEKEV
jgi:hypothetical protein